MRHELKTWPDFFQATLEGRKSFELRKNDRNFQVGDILILREYFPSLPGTSHYSGRTQTRSVVFLMDADSGLHDNGGVKEGYCVMGTFPVGE